jgi:hypothetical protein
MSAECTTISPSIASTGPGGWLVAVASAAKAASCSGGLTPVSCLMFAADIW